MLQRHGRCYGDVARGESFDALTPLKLPSQLPSTLLNRRPDIVQAERQLIAADATLAASRASLLPSINLTATGSVQDILHRSRGREVDRRQQAGARCRQRRVCRNQLTFRLNDIRAPVE